MEDRVKGKSIFGRVVVFGVVVVCVLFSGALGQSFSGTVTPGSTDRNFSPAKRSNSNMSEWGDENYPASSSPVISGHVTGGGYGMEGVAVSADNGGGADTTDAAGYYEVTVPSNWSGTIIPSKSGLYFNPASRSYSDVDSNQPEQNYEEANGPPITLSTQVSGTYDDGYYTLSDEGFGIRHYQDLTSNVLYIGWRYPMTGLQLYTIGMRFTNVEVPQYAGINSAYLTLRFSLCGDLDLYGRIKGESSDNPGDFRDIWIKDRDTVGGSVQWNHPESTWENGAWRTSPDLSNITSKIVNRSGWQPGNAMVFLYDNEGVVGYYRCFWSYDLSDGWSAPKLEITYEYPPKVSGYVIDANGGAVKDMVVSADNGGGSYTTDANGYYEVRVPPEWTGTIKPDKAYWVFEPAERLYTNLYSDRENQNFTAYSPLRIWGAIADSNNTATAEVLVLADNGGGSDITDANGYYEFPLPHSWSGTITPSKGLWVFEPNERVYSNVTTDQANQDYTSFVPHAVWGHVRDSNGVGTEGVLVSTDSNVGPDTTDSNGYYEFIVPHWWSGTVTPNKGLWGFDPSERTYSNVTADQAEQDYTIFAPPVISGWVRSSSDIGITGVLVSTDSGGQSDTTGMDGYYSMAVQYGWSGTVSASKPGWSFVPVSYSYSNLVENAANEDFAVTGMVIAGHVINIGGLGVPDVLLSADGGGSSTTDSNGFYALPVSIGWSGTLSVSKGPRRFEPASRVYPSVTADLTEQDFLSLELRLRADGSGDYSDIQAAIDAAVDGDEVVVESGLYTGLGNSSIDFKGKAITVRSTEPNDVNVVAATVVEPNVGNYESYWGFYFISGEGPNSVLDGLTISGRDFWVHGIMCSRSSPTIRNCIIEECRSIGIDLWDSNSVIENCLVDGCGGHSEMGGGAISCWGGASVTISNCVVSNGTAGEWYGLEGISCGENDAIISNCTIIDNNGIGMYLRSGEVTVTDCTIRGNKNRAGGEEGGGGGILCYLSNVTITNCTVSDNGDPIGRGFGGVGGWGSGSLTISDCIISNNYTSYSGGGIYWPEDNSNVVISDCTIQGNTAEGSGGGVYAGEGLMTGAEGTISDCIIADNTAQGDGGGLCGYVGLVRGCKITGNTGGVARKGGGGGGLFGCSGPIIDCTISGNRTAGNGGGVGRCGGPITNCSITSNIAEGVGGALAVIHGAIKNCVITGNKSGLVGGGLCRCLSVGNCTIAGNTGTEGGGLMDCHEISNCIIRNNFADVNSQLSGTSSLIHSCIEGWTGGGEGNIDVDPCFVEAGYWVDVNDANVVVEPNDPNGVWVEGDYHLLAGSLCIDAGDPNYAGEPNETDIDGEPRVMGGRVDIGADEVGLYLDFGVDEFWMYQNLPGQSNSDLTAGVSITDDPMSNSSYSYAWEIVQPGDVSLAPVTVAGGGAGDAYWTFAARGCDEPGGLSDSGQVFKVRVTVTGDDYGNTGVAEAKFGIALLGDVNNDGIINVADRSIANAFWRFGSVGSYTFRDCDVNSDGIINVADRSIANAVWRGLLGQTWVSSPCPLR